MFRAFLIVCLHVMYRRIEAPGVETVPAQGGVLLVANHGNALMDPLLLLVVLRRPITFLAKHTLFPMPLVGFFLKRIGGVPVYRRHEAPGESEKNEATLDLCGAKLASGGMVCLFPEGVSHNAPRLLSLRSGAARIYFRAARQGERAPAIVPAGIHSESKRAFRSRVLVVFGRPVDTAGLLETDRLTPGAAVGELTRRIETSLAALVPGLDTWEELAFLRDVRSFHVGRYGESLTEEAVSLRRFIQAYRHYREKTPDEVRAIQERWQSYRRQLNRFSIRDSWVTLSRTPVRAAGFFVASVLMMVGVFPLALAGWLTHYPAYWLCGALERRFNRHEDQSATFRLIAGILLFPLTYVVVLAWLGWWKGSFAALLGCVLLPLCGWAALRLTEERLRLKESAKALRLALVPGKAVEAIRKERQEILEAVARLLREHPPEAAAQR